MRKIGRNPCKGINRNIQSNFVMISVVINEYNSCIFMVKFFLESKIQHNHQQCDEMLSSRVAKRMHLLRLVMGMWVLIVVKVYCQTKKLRQLTMALAACW